MIHFSFTKIVVTDLDVCGAFYTEVFGLREQYRLRSEIGGRAIDEVLFAATAPGAGSFILLRFVDPTEGASAGVIPGFVTDEIDALFARAIGAGGSVEQRIADAPAHGVRVGFLADPEGRLIEVVQRLEA